ncbi:hypothetical protein PHAVU_011G089100 [Phaseolus vulgaris]|uniref:Uncharacterized protein n=1 Tax=Phaseolus vulgaris TaxID=3885 RepID=V7AFP1_PHAVU|nr:hypothetical protein PHAVU_011G089100g [Phaseolus vulgaris]ESW04364.1 hypothetical protein PHAVU_011G089100g [Phaseolus vulgaris]
MHNNTRITVLSGTRTLFVFFREICNCQNKERQRLHVGRELDRILMRFLNESKNLVFHLYQVILQSILISCEMFFPDGDHFLDHLLKLQEAVSLCYMFVCCQFSYTNFE